MDDMHKRLVGRLDEEEPVDPLDDRSGLWPNVPVPVQRIRTRLDAGVVESEDETAALVLKATGREEEPAPDDRDTGHGQTAS